MTPIITKQQIAKYVQLSENIDDEQINPFILDAQQYDTIPILPDTLLNAIEAQVMLKLQQWNKNKTYSIADAVWFGSERRFYLATTEHSNSVPPSGNWKAFELMNFYEQYLQPFLAFSFYYRFIAYHGANVTQFGIRQMREDSSDEISDKRRAEMLGDICSKKDVWVLKMSKALNDAKYTFNGVKYAVDNGERTHLKPKVKIFQLGGRHRNSRRLWGNNGGINPYST